VFQRFRPKPFPLPPPIKSPPFSLSPPLAQSLHARNLFLTVPFKRPPFSVVSVVPGFLFFLTWHQAFFYARRFILPSETAFVPVLATFFGLHTSNPTLLFSSHFYIFPHYYSLKRPDGVLRARTLLHLNRPRFMKRGLWMPIATAYIILKLFWALEVHGFSTGGNNLFDILPTFLG